MEETSFFETSVTFIDHYGLIF